MIVVIGRDTWYESCAVQSRIHKVEELVEAKLTHSTHWTVLMACNKPMLKISFWCCFPSVWLWTARHREICNGNVLQIFFFNLGTTVLKELNHYWNVK